MTISSRKAFRIFDRDGFCCRYCGDRPGRSHLQVDHVIPRSRGGTDDEANLVSSCTPCNQGKSNSFCVPHSMRLGTDDDGFHVIALQGVWCIKVGPAGVFVSGAVYGEHSVLRSGDCYEMAADCALDRWTPSHIEGKTWGEPHSLHDFFRCREILRRLVYSRSEKTAHV